MKRFLAYSSLGIALLAVGSILPRSAKAEDATKIPPLEKRSEWWRQAKFGMFIHWGVYSVPAHGEWYMNQAKMQVKDYEQYPPQFNPTDFNAKEWVRIAKEAGMKYITITSKHHDGFCMFHTKLTKYNLYDATPFKRDPLKELSEECRKQGIKLCFYYSVMDWHHPDYLPRRAWETETRPADGADFNRYLAYMKGQLKELLTNYGPIGVIWFDGGWEGDAQKDHSQEIVNWIHSFQPNVLINDRINLPEDFSTPEQTIPAGAMPNGRLWETCMTMNDDWGFNKDDHDWKSTADIARKLIDIASKGGNFLLNVGPTQAGVIPPESVTRLHEVGEWMKRNGACIYGSTKSPYKKTPFDGRCTVKGNSLYVEAFDWPESGLKLTGLKTPVVSAKTLSGEKLTAKAGTDESGNPTVILSRPAHLDPIATIAVLQLSGAPEVAEMSASITPDKKGSLALKAEDGDIHGKTMQLQGQGEDQNLGYWINADDYVSWSVKTTKADLYNVYVDYACDPGSAGATFAVLADPGSEKARGEIRSTGSWNDFTSQFIGRIRMEPGSHVLSVKALTMPNGAVMNLKSVRLIPLANTTDD